MLRRFDCSEAVAGSNFPAFRERSEVRGIAWNLEGLALAIAAIRRIQVKKSRNQRAMENL
jgi:hypothetical protein